MTNKNKKILFIGIFILLLFLGYILTKGDNSKNLLSLVLSKLGKFDINLEGPQSVSYKNDASQLSVKKGSFPEGFPKDFPHYPNSTVISGWKETNDKNYGYSIIIETGDSIETVYGFYKNKLMEESWKIGSKIITEESGTISFEKEGARGFVGISKKGDKVEILATIGIIN